MSQVAVGATPAPSVKTVGSRSSGPGSDGSAFDQALASASGVAAGSSDAATPVSGNAVIVNVTPPGTVLPGTVLPGSVPPGAVPPGAAPAKPGAVSGTAPPVDLIALAQAASSGSRAGAESPAAPDGAKADRGKADEGKPGDAAGPAKDGNTVAAADAGSTTATPPAAIIPPPPMPLAAIVAARPQGEASAPPDMPAGGGGIITGAPITGGAPAATGDAAFATSAGSAGGDGVLEPGFTVPEAVAVPSDASSIAAQAGSPAQQIVDALQSLGLNAVTATATATTTSAKGTPAAASPPPAAVATQGATATNGGVVTISLNPDNLGKVSITLRMRADTVDIKIEVERPQTLALLEKDKHVLTAAIDAVSRKGDVDLSQGLTAQTVDSTTRSTSAGVPGGSTDDQQQRSLPDSAPGQSRRQDERAPRASLQDQVNDNDTTAPTRSAPARPGGSLYL